MAHLTLLLHHGFVCQIITFSALLSSYIYLSMADLKVWCQTQCHFTLRKLVSSICAFLDSTTANKSLCLLLLPGWHGFIWIKYLSTNVVGSHNGVALLYGPV